MLNQLRQYRAASSKSHHLPDVVLHVGAPKCGSSAIQRFCISHQEVLKKAGFFYPEHPLDVNGVSGGHTQVAGALVNGNVEQARRRFLQWLNQARKQEACLLLSAEAFYGQHEALRSLTDGLEVEVVAFLRHPLEYLLGNHNQSIKRHMSTRRLNDLLPELLSRPAGQLVGRPLIDWAEAMGDARCHFHAYASPAAGGPPIERRFMEILGIDQHDVSLLENLNGHTNRSYVKSALELKRLLNTVLTDLPAQHAHQVDWSLQGYSDRAHQEHSIGVADLSEEVRSRLQAHLMEQMRPVVARFPALKPVSLEGPRARPASAPAWLDLSRPLAALRKDCPEVLEAIRAHAILRRDAGRCDYTFCKLLDVLGIEFHEPDSEEGMRGLGDHQRKVLAAPASREADILREMAILLERQGLIENARFVINQAYERRPNGAVIQKLRARMQARHRLLQTGEDGLDEQDISTLATDPGDPARAAEDGSTPAKGASPTTGGEQDEGGRP